MSNFYSHFSEIVDRTFNGDAAGNVRSAVKSRDHLFKDIDVGSAGLKTIPPELKDIFVRLTDQLHREYDEMSMDSVCFSEIDKSVELILNHIFTSEKPYDEDGKGWILGHS